MTERLNLDVGEICRRYDAGESAPAIAKALGISRVTVRARLIEVGVKMRRPGRATSYSSAEVIARYRAGETLAELGVAYSRSASTIWQLLVRRGELRRRLGMRPHVAAKISQRFKNAGQSRGDCVISDYDAGLSLREIGAKHQLCAERVNQILVRYGFNKRRVGAKLYEASVDRTAEVTEMAAAHSAGASYREIALRFGFTRNAVKCALKRFHRRQQAEPGAA